jgi:hypothetical protein
MFRGMSMKYWFRGELTFRDQAAIDAALEELATEGCVGHEDNAVTEADLRWNGRVLTVDMRGWMPYSCFEISSFVLSIYAQHAASGELIAFNLDDGVGSRLRAGGEQDDLKGDEIEALRREYS